MGKMIKRATDINLISASVLKGGKASFSFEILNTEDQLEAHDVRKGNCVYVLFAADTQGNPPLWEMRQLRSTDIPAIEDYPNIFNPIPLTEEWLIKFGFKKDYSGWYSPSKTAFSLTDKFYPCWGERMIWPQDVAEYKLFKLEYVHQLQNLYFALTGEELQIKE